MHPEIETTERRYKDYFRRYDETYLIPDVEPPREATLELELLFAAWTQALMQYASAVPPFDVPSVPDVTTGVSDPTADPVLAPHERTLAFHGSR